MQRFFFFFLNESCYKGTMIRQICCVGLQAKRGHFSITVVSIFLPIYLLRMYHFIDNLVISILRASHRKTCWQDNRLT